MQYRPLFLPALTIVAAVGLQVGTPAAHADNKRLNESVISNVFTVQHQAGCKNDIRTNPQLQLAAEWHTRDMMSNRNLDGDIGSDGSTPQSRANAAGFRGRVAQTVAMNPALAISGNDLINQWYYRPDYFAIMSNCTYNQMGVWSENSLDRTVVVAVYGASDPPIDTTTPIGPELGFPPGVTLQQNVPHDPSPDYDGSDEIEYFFDWFPWILRGAYPPPAMPPN
jgi:uncharacterized protein YkwD